MAILLVDDEPFVLGRMQSELTYRGGYDTLTADSVSAALALLRSRQDISCVILDILMRPEPPISAEESGDGRFTGLALGRLLKREYPDLPVIGVSAERNELAEHWFRSHGDGFFHKPFDADVILRHLRAVLGGRRTLRSFIVHGHDDLAKLQLRNYLQSNLGLPEPLVLQEQPSQGRTLIEKLEEAADRVDVVFVLLTPDDKFTSEKGQPIERARQNVILELGYFLGRFGRRGGQIIFLYKGALDIPSDLSGLVYLNIENGIEAAGEEIRRELARGR